MERPPGYNVKTNKQGARTVCLECYLLTRGIMVVKEEYIESYWLVFGFLGFFFAKKKHWKDTQKAIKSGDLWGWVWEVEADKDMSGSERSINLFNVHFDFCNVCKQHLIKKAKRSLKLNKEYGYFENVLLCFITSFWFIHSYITLYSNISLIITHRLKRLVYNQLIMGVEYVFLLLLRKDIQKGKTWK